MSLRPWFTCGWRVTHCSKLGFYFSKTLLQPRRRPGIALRLISWAEDSPEAGAGEALRGQGAPGVGPIFSFILGSGNPRHQMLSKDG